MSGDRHELFDLIALACDNDLKPDQLARLEELLHGDEEAQQLYLGYLRTDAALRWEFGDAAEAIRRTAADIPWEASGPWRGSRAASPVLGFLGAIGRQGWGYVADRATFFVAISALLLLSLSWIALRLHPDHGQVAASNEQEARGASSQHGVKEAETPRKPVPASRGSSRRRPAAGPAPGLSLLRGRSCRLVKDWGLPRGPRKSCFIAAPPSESKGRPFLRSFRTQKCKWISARRRHEWIRRRPRASPSA